MPANAPPLTAQATEALVTVGQAIARRRKALRVSAVAAAEAAGMSRVTLHRIEKGEPSVTAGAYMAACAALGLKAQLLAQEEAADKAATAGRKGWIPARVRIADWPRLQELAWQVHGTPELTPRAAWDIYQRNWRHIGPSTLSQEEQDLVDALRLALEDGVGV
ncbi:helix-turn-helix domain-containing protein [uncultured Ramlibacter sp.]|uniref:helix-turn-helix domain-containing protein n=1 Tax=uncultured Ramlibacter sp. TaxID=260755 RepID=UPI0026310C4E|nr:helix-turn-helix domain-containing protein [uncultured Ramlibacter sp.]